MRFPINFPNEPPSITFLNPMMHPNIFRDGKICISSLQVPPPGASAQEASANWTPVLGIHGALQSVVSLLSDPNPNDPANAEAASLFVNDRSQFEAIAKKLSEESFRSLPPDVCRPAVFHHQCSPTKVARKAVEDDDEYEYSDTDDHNQEGEEEEEEA